MKTLSLLGLAALLALGSSCEGDTPSEYPAATPAPAAGGTDAQLAEAEARIAQLEAQQAGSQPAAAPAPAPRAPSRSSGGSFTLPPNPTTTGVYSGDVVLSGQVVFCETYDNTSVASFHGMQLCYRANLDQHRDGSLAGSGVKISEETRSNGYRDLPPSEQSPVRVSGYVDDSNLIHLEYAVQGSRRTTKAIGQYRRNGGPDTYTGTFRTDAANASGGAVLEAY